MLEYYNPVKAKKLDMIVEITYMFGSGKAIVRMPVAQSHVGLSALVSSAIATSWACELDGDGNFQDIKLVGISYMDYDDDLDMLIVHLNDGNTVDVCGLDMAAYIVKIEIVEIGGRSNNG